MDNLPRDRGGAVVEAEVEGEKTCASLSSSAGGVTNVGLKTMADEDDLVRCPRVCDDVLGLERCVGREGALTRGGVGGGSTSSSL